MNSYSQTNLQFLALGDSYTIGEAVGERERWPVQLVERLRAQDLRIEAPRIVAQTGWTTDELLQGIRQANISGEFELVSLQIGVNNQYRGYPLDDYRDKFRALLNQAVSFAGGKPGRVLVLSIPDWSVTPFAAGRDRQRIAAEIERFNLANRAEAAAAGARYVDVTLLSRLADQDPSLLASDGLHPSGKMYAAWVEWVLPKALIALDAQASSAP